MKTNKIGTIFLLLIMVFTLTLSAGCGKENQKPENKEETLIGDKGDNDKENKEKTPEKQEEKKTVKLLKRNGVEWKENTRINSYVGAQKYKVVWGDTLSLIARTWKVNCYKLAEYNHIKNIDLIEVDQVIYNYAYKK